MERRKFVVGLGALAAGGAAATGTGAFSAARLDSRGADIEVRGDQDALIQLIPGHEHAKDGTVEENRVRESENNQLLIDFDDSGNDHGNGDGTGVGPHSTYQIGAMDGTNLDKIEYGPEDGDGREYSLDEDILYDDPDASSDPAFVIRNESDNDFDFELGWDGDEVPDREKGAAAAQVFDASGAGSTAFTMELGGSEDSTTFELDAGEEAYVSLIVSTLDISPQDNWEGDLTLRAGQETRMF